MLILTGLLWQQVQPRSPDAVPTGFEPPDLPEAAKTELVWRRSLPPIRDRPGLVSGKLCYVAAFWGQPEVK